MASIVVAGWLPLAVLQGCAMNGGLSEAATDPSIVTNSVGSTKPADNDLASDRLTVQNAVSSADLGNLTGTDLSWRNAATGSTGVVSAISEEREGEVECRRFQTTRTSYSGIAIHEGEICAGRDGLWWTKSFKPI